MVLKSFVQGLTFKKAMLICVAMISILLCREISRVIEVGNQPTKYGDGYSEQNAVYGAKAFENLGIGKYYGLPDPCVGAAENATPCVYTHYPPGPEYFVYVSHLLTGSFNFDQLRILALITNFLLLFFTAWLLLKKFDHLFVIVLLGLLTVHPFFSRFWHNLHYQGFAFYLLFFQFAVSLFLKERKVATLAALFFCSFLQGWLSFDYFFVVALGPAVFYGFIYGFDFKKTAWIFLTCSAGFGIAHLAHFLQVIFYFGSFDKALEDFLNAAKNRANNEVIIINWVPEKALNPFKLVLMYFSRFTKRHGFLPVSLDKYILITLALGLIYSYFKAGRKFLKSNFDKKTMTYLLVGFIASSMWVIVMRQHSYIHFSFINQHYFLFVLMWIIWVLRKFFNLSMWPRT